MTRSSEVIQTELWEYVKERLSHGHPMSRINHSYHFLKLEQEYLDAVDYEHEIQDLKPFGEQP